MSDEPDSFCNALRKPLALETWFSCAATIVIYICMHRGRMLDDAYADIRNIKHRLTFGSSFGSDFSIPVTSFGSSSSPVPKSSS
jgi:hypothetical protein